MNIINAVPQSNNLGINDVSGRKLNPQPLNLPSHLPKVFGFTQKGKASKSHLVVGDSRTSIYGTASFDPLGPYFNHATVFANAFNSVGNAVMFERVLPPDAKPAAAVRLSLDILSTQVQDFTRNADGTYAIDVQGNKIPTANKIPGYLGKWVAELIPVVDGVRTFGQGATVAGDQTDSVTHTQSTRYPIMDFMVSSEGDWGNNQGFSIAAYTAMSNTPVDSRLIVDQKVYPFQISVKARPDALTTATIVPTLGGSQNVPFVLKPRTIDRNNGGQISLADVFVPAYNNTSTPGYSPTYGSFDKLKVYDSNVATVLGLIYASEFPQADQYSDLVGDDDEIYRLNPFTAVSSLGAPYRSFQLVTGASNSVRLVDTAVVFAKDGSDGTMNDTVFATAVKAKLLEYGDKNSVRQDAVTNPENIIWDSGFPLDTKKAMANFIAVRKGTFVQAASHVANGADLTDEQERSLAITLTAAFQNFPESEYYATPTVRAAVIVGSAYLLNSTYVGSLPMAYDRALKWAGYMGASNGKWVSNKSPDVAPNNQVTTMRDPNVVSRPAAARSKDWDANMVWPEPYSMDMMYFPQHQTVYPDDTSVLNSAITAFACATLIAIGEKAHRDNTGRSDLTKDQMAESITANILAQVKDKYDGRFLIVPVTEYTADDDLRGYSWTTTIKLGGPNMMTVQTLTVQSYRKDDLAAATAA